MTNIITTRFLMCDRLTKRTVLEFENRDEAMRALHAIAPARRDKYELIPHVISRPVAFGGCVYAKK